MKKIIISIFIVIIFISIGCFIFIPKYINSDDVNKNEVVEKETKEEIKTNLETDSEENISTDIVDKNDNDNIKIEEKSEDNNKTNIKEEKKETIKENKTNSTSKQNDSKQEETKGEEKVETPKVETSKNAWDELGISEYDYYHKPMWSWGRIDYSIEDYKTYDKTREACITKGEEYFNEGIGYSCTSLNSYSGDYLGEMLKTF